MATAVKNRIAQLPSPSRTMALLFLSALSIPSRARAETPIPSKSIRTACIAAPSKRTRHKAARTSEAPAANNPTALPASSSSLQAPAVGKPLTLTPQIRKLVERLSDSPSYRRKPHGYWNQLSNIERELLLVNLQLRRPARTMPRVRDLKALSRGDLLAGIMKHGGLGAVANALRWGRTPRGGSMRAVKPAREKVFRRPVAYWQDVSRVRCEMTAFIDEFGVRGVMPTRKQLYAFGRSDLANAAMRHGGLRALARDMLLKCRTSARPRGYWKDFTQLRRVVLEFSDRFCAGKMPTADELASKGFSCVVNAVAAHGGFPAVACKCGLKPRNVKRQGAPLLWDEVRVRREYLSFVMTFYPQLAKERVMVGERQLRLHGRNDLSYAIGKFGGFGKLAKALDLKKRVFRKSDDGSASSSSSSSSSSTTAAPSASSVSSCANASARPPTRGVSGPRTTPTPSSSWDSPSPPYVRLEYQ